MVTVLEKTKDRLQPGDMISCSAGSTQIGAAGFRKVKPGRSLLGALHQYQNINSFLQNMLAAADPYQRGRDTKVIDLLDEAEDELKICSSDATTPLKLRAKSPPSYLLTLPNLPVIPHLDYKPK